jgi:DnaJ domain/PilZ domain
MTNSGRVQRRRTGRKSSEPTVVRVRLKDRQGVPRWATGYLSDLTDGGVGLSLMTPLQIGSMVVIRGNLGEDRTDVQLQADVKWCTERGEGVYQAGLELAGHRQAGAANERQQQAPASDSDTFSADPEQLDCYEVMQLNPNADADTVRRVHRILAQRYHPDTPDTGNAEMFIRLTAAARILSDSEKRAKYDARYHASKQLQWKIFDQAEAVQGPQAERAKRRGILGLLYAKAVHDPECGGMTAVSFEEMLGCPREHLQAALWYLKGKGFIARGDNGRYSITVQGFDEVETHSMMAAPGALKMLEPASLQGA